MLLFIVSFHQASAIIMVASAVFATPLRQGQTVDLSDDVTLEALATFAATGLARRRHQADEPMPPMPAMAAMGPIAMPDMPDTVNVPALPLDRLSFSESARMLHIPESWRRTDGDDGAIGAAASSSSTSASASSPSTAASSSSTSASSSSTSASALESALMELMEELENPHNDEAAAALPDNLQGLQLVPMSADEMARVVPHPVAPRAAGPGGAGRAGAAGPGLGGRHCHYRGPRVPAGPDGHQWQRADENGRVHLMGRYTVLGRYVTKQFESHLKSCVRGPCNVTCKGTTTQEVFRRFIPTELGRRNYLKPFNHSTVTSTSIFPIDSVVTAAEAQQFRVDFLRGPTRDFTAADRRYTPF